MHKETTKLQPELSGTEASIALRQGEKKFQEFMRINGLSIDHYYNDCTLLMNDSTLLMDEETDQNNNVKILLKLGADILLKDRSERKQTALHYAARFNMDVNLNLLLRELENRNQLADGVNIKDGSGRTPLFYACLKGNGKCMDLLLKAGADPTIADNSGQLPTHVLGQRNEEFNETLRARLAQKLTMQIERQTLAKYRQEAESVKQTPTPTTTATKPPVPPKPVQRRNSLQGNRGAAFFDQNLGPSRQKTPSPPHDGSLSRSSGSEETTKPPSPVKVPEELQRQIDEQLILACTLEQYDTVEDLLKNKHANPNHVNIDGTTPLRVAIGRDNQPIIKLLLKYKADPSIAIAALQEQKEMMLEKHAQEHEEFIQAQRPVAREIIKDMPCMQSLYASAADPNHPENEISRQKIENAEKTLILRAATQARKPSSLTHSYNDDEDNHARADSSKKCAIM